MNSSAAGRRSLALLPAWRTQVPVAAWILPGPEVNQQGLCRTAAMHQGFSLQNGSKSTKSSILSFPKQSDNCLSIDPFFRTVICRPL
ncbi:hypothetical protein VTO42DRAFT_890 [Malbranchea cinnamomea]